jgi:hypothetical protein
VLFANNLQAQHIGFTPAADSAVDCALRDQQPTAARGQAMELRQLRYFVSVVAQGSMGRAALELGVGTRR